MSSNKEDICNKINIIGLLKVAAQICQLHSRKYTGCITAHNDEYDILVKFME
jgi:hypothetical protein